MNSKAFDLVATAAAAALGMTLMLQTAAGDVFRIFFALPLVLLLPGYALTAALVPGPALGLAERVLCSIGLSLAAAALGGLLLNLAPGGLRDVAWAALLGNLTLVASLVALVRRLRLPLAPARVAPPLSQTQALLFGLSAVLVCGAVLVARDGAVQRPTAGFTQLWMQPSGVPGQERVRLGLANMEPGATHYRLELHAGGDLAAAWPAIVLGPDQRWEEEVALPPALPGVTTPLEAVLYRLDAPDTPYRRVTLREGSSAGPARP